jgi:hypothetical protein
MRLAIGHNPAPPLKPSRPPCFDGSRRCNTITAVTIPPADTEGQPAIATHPQTQEHLFEVVPPICAMSIGLPGRSWSLGGVCIHPIERNSCRVLMQPGRRDGLHL